MATNVRPPAVAGFFYPADPDELAADVDTYLAEAPDHGLSPKALIAPHAGYRYSAPIAASVYAGLHALAGRVRRVVLLGPAHRVAVRGLAVPSVGAFETPFGQIPLDSEGRAALTHLPHVVVDDEPHAPEHSLEVHLPFLQRVLGPSGPTGRGTGDFTLLPLAVGAADPAEVADVIERCWGGDETLVVISSDLSHYHDYETARRRDAETTRAIEALRSEDLHHESACGVRPVAGMLVVARQRGMRVVTLDVRSSGDTSGEKDRVVGYGSWAFLDEAPPTLADDDGRRLAELARATVEYGVRGGTAGEPRLDGLPQRLARPQAAFVTLKHRGGLRGCVGGVEAVKPLAAAVVRAASNAAFADPRFPPLSPEELPGMELSVSVLSPLERVFPADDAALLGLLRPGVDGLVLADGSTSRGVFLPQVWEQVADPAEFVTRLKQKAGLPVGHWSDTLAAYRFTVEHFE